ncbi:hypothetical protein EU527_16685 [Candidatus Thorarchaeota archaeon]|nr:MAG: hypothetical protein EU527_16685 [Candidatus Thorarchaeota archaeon]
MGVAGNKHVLIESLNAMRKNLESSYDLKTYVDEESRLLQGLGSKYPGYLVFSDYRRNEGKRRFNEITELIGTAVSEIECCDTKKAAIIYLETLKAVLLQSRWVNVLEIFANDGSEVI